MDRRSDTCTCLHRGHGPIRLGVISNAFLSALFGRSTVRLFLFYLSPLRFHVSMVTLFFIVFRS